MESMESLMARVKADNDPKRSTVILVNGIADALDELTQDPLAIRRMAAELRASAESFGMAVCCTVHASQEHQHDLSKSRRTR